MKVNGVAGSGSSAGPPRAVKEIPIAEIDRFLPQTGDVNLRGMFKRGTKRTPDYAGGRDQGEDGNCRDRRTNR